MTDATVTDNAAAAATSVSPAPSDLVPWQRVPHGWIEFSAFRDDATADGWWDAYLTPAGTALGDAEREQLGAAFRQGRELFRSSPFDFAGVIPVDLDTTPSIYFLGTAILPAGADDAAVADITATFARGLRVGEVDSTESFTTSDGRHGEATHARCRVGDDEHESGLISAVVPVPGSRRTALVIGVCPTPEERLGLSAYVALSVDTIRLQPRAQTRPPAYSPRPAPAGLRDLDRDESAAGEPPTART